MNNNSKETPYAGNVIILNKPFSGGWLNKQGNIGHEIIDFLLTDKGEYYVYNNPWGICPDNIWVEGNSELEKKRREKYLAKYLVLTSEERGKEFSILYVIELAEKLHRYHRYHTTKAINNEFRNRQTSVKEIIDKREIKYNGKSLYEIYGDDDSLYVTFKGSRIWKACPPIEVNGICYNFQRNKGYIYDDKHHEDYKKLYEIITKSIEEGKLIKFDPPKANPTENESSKPTFINLIKQEENEQIFTNILFSILEQGELLKHFCQSFKGDKTFKDDDYKVLREEKVVDGRMDICAEGPNQRIIIENKINSGLNGLKPADNTSQLSTYYEWGKAKKTTEPLCFVVAPDYRVSELEKEIKAKDPEMKEKYIIKTYGEIADFIKQEKDNNNIPDTYLYKPLIDQIIDAFRNLSYSKEVIYARKFFEATK